MGKTGHVADSRACGCLRDGRFQFIAYFLHRRFPGETVIQYCPRILGWFGKGIAVIFLLTYIHANSFVIRIYADFVNGVFLRETPQAVVMGGMALLCAAAVRGELETVTPLPSFSPC